MDATAAQVFVEYLKDQRLIVDVRRHQFNWMSLTRYFTVFIQCVFSADHPSFILLMKSPRSVAGYALLVRVSIAWFIAPANLSTVL
jgi:hypothetical protein